jgi:sphinganine-1-phosphate aldolase
MTTTAPTSLPRRVRAGYGMALDVAAPALREALLVAFLDRLARPVRRTTGVAR